LRQFRNKVTLHPATESFALTAPAYSEDQLWGCPGQVQAQPGAHGWADPSDASNTPTICQPTLPCLSCLEITESRVVGKEKPEELNKCPQKTQPVQTDLCANFH
jgi:hypothetical protein